MTEVHDRGQRVVDLSEVQRNVLSKLWTRRRSSPAACVASPKRILNVTSSVGIIVEIKTKGVKTFFPKASPMGSKLNSRSLRSTH